MYFEEVIEVKKKIDWVRVVVYSIAFVVCAGLISAYAAGWRKTAERSMEPTLSLVSFVRVHFGEQPTKPNQIVIIVPKGRSDQGIKRVGDIAKDGSLFVTADNKGVTGEDSDNYGRVPKENVVGVVTQIITLRTILRSFTWLGRFRNWVEFAYGPSGHVSREGSNFAISGPSSFVTYDMEKVQQGKWIPHYTAGTFVSWESDTLANFCVGTQSRYQYGGGGAVFVPEIELTRRNLDRVGKWTKKGPDHVAGQTTIRFEIRKKDVGTGIWLKTDDGPWVDYSGDASFMKYFK